MNETVLVDTGFWIALFDERDADHVAAIEKGVYLEAARPILPWPTIYEVLRTRFVRRRAWVAGLDQLLRRLPIALLDDAPYRENAYTMTIDFAAHRDWSISMVDMICRLVIADPNVPISYLLTTNPADFVDVCAVRGVEIL